MAEAILSRGGSEFVIGEVEWLVARLLAGLAGVGPGGYAFPSGPGVLGDDEAGRLAGDLRRALDLLPDREPGEGDRNLYSARFWGRGKRGLRDLIAFVGGGSFAWRRP